MSTLGRMRGGGRVFALLLLAGLWVSAEVPETHFIDRILPTPQQVRYGDMMRPFEKATGRPVVMVLLGQNPGSLEQLAAEWIERKLEALDLSPAPVVRVGREGMVSKLGADWLIYLAREGDAAHLDGLDLEGPPARPEAYALQAFHAEGSRGVVIHGSDARGLFYGVQSFLQMMTVREGDLMWREFTARDWPAFRLRLSGDDERVPPESVSRAAVSWLAHFKMSGWAVGQSYHWPEDWRRMPQDETQSLRGAAELASTGMADLYYQIHPFGRADDPEGARSVRISEGSDRERVLRQCLSFLEGGATHILLRADDFAPLSPADRSVFRDRAEAHADLIRFLHEGMGQRFPEARLLFTPPYYTGREVWEEAEARRYLERLSARIPSDVILMWTGPEVVSAEFTLEEVERWQALAGSPPLLWDNTVLREVNPFGYRYRYAWNLLQPYEPALPRGLDRNTPGIRFNYGFDGGEIARVGNIVLADYLWNPEAYDARTSLRDAVAMVVGPQAVGPTLEVARLITRIFDLRHTPTALTLLRESPSPERFERAMDDLRSSTDNQKMVNALQERWWAQAETSEALDRAVRRWRRLQENHLSHLHFRGAGTGWRANREGAWRTSIEDRRVVISFPYATESAAGSYGEMRRSVPVPRSPTGRYFLHFVADDDNTTEGEPPAAWPGYFFKQVWVNGEVIWEDDVVGWETPEVIEVEITAHLEGKSSFDLRLRGYDARGVSNLGVNIGFSELFLSARSLGEEDDG